MSEHNKSRTVVTSKPVFLFVGLAGLWSIWAFQFSNPVELTRDYLHYIFLGITGAIFANSTGAGGGVIFIPVFSSLNFSNEQSLSTSFAIQCFGMTAGAFSWWRHYLQQKLQKNAIQWRALPKVLALATPASITGIWLGQLFPHLLPQLGAQLIPQLASLKLELYFSMFSILLGLAIIYSSFKTIKVEQSEITCKQSVEIIGLSFVGGLVTAYLSVGIGELLVIYLMLNRFNAGLAVAAGVITTAFTVWSISPIHLSPAGDAYFNVVLMAGPGAVLGGLLAKRLALFLPGRSLKLFFAVWILVSGFVIISLA